MHKKFEINQTKIKGGCQSGREVVTHNSKSDLPLGEPVRRDRDDVHRRRRIAGLAVNFKA